MKCALKGSPWLKKILKFYLLKCPRLTQFYHILSFIILHHGCRKLWKLTFWNATDWLNLTTFWICSRFLNNNENIWRGKCRIFHWISRQNICPGRCRNFLWIFRQNNCSGKCRNLIWICRQNNCPKFSLNLSAK